MTGLVRDIRLHIYEQMIETSAAPSAADVARALAIDAADVEAAFLALAEARMLVLRPGTTTIWMAMPFSNVQTPFTVISGGRAYYANCASDAFGVAAVMRADPRRTDARIFTTCPDCGGALERKIAGVVLAETRGLVHFSVPARRWWDDIGRTCASTLLFGDEHHLDRWCARHRVSRGETVALEQMWILARQWYEHRLDHAWQRPSARTATDAFAAAGLTGPFWELE